jgi:hypothetical protein
VKPETTSESALASTPAVDNTESKPLYFLAALLTFTAFAVAQQVTMCTDSVMNDNVS